MDTITHAIIGVAAAGLSGHPFSLNDPVYLAVLIGSQAPDIDIAAYAKGKVNYLRQHRAFSHSVPGIMLWSALASLGFSLFLPNSYSLFFTVFFWCFSGCLSHVAIDYLNTHGVAFLWPFSKKRLSLNLLNVFDPCLLIMMLSVLALKLSPVLMSLSVFAVLGGYAAFRYFLRRRSSEHLTHLFDGVEEKLVLPSLKGILFWDFIVKTHHSVYVGQIGALRPALSIRAQLSKEEVSGLTKIAQKTNLGQFFSIFTPFSYFQEGSAAADNAKIVRIYDLRYCIESGFAYSAAIVFGSDGLPCDSYIYTYGEKFRISCF